MSKELNELRSQSLRPGATCIDNSSFSPNIARSASPATQADDFSLSIEIVKIGSVIVSAGTAVEAFKIFASLFHPILPILVPININAIYHSSPLLFWTIIAIVASHTTVPSSEGLYDQIAGPFQDMVRIEALQAPLSLQSILALLLLCMWPMPVEIQTKDPSWIYSGIATNSALFLGLHRTGSQPPPSGNNGLSGNPLERVMAWLGCFYVNSCLSMHFGLRVMFDSSAELAKITAYLEEWPISREFASEIKLQAIIADFKNVLSHTANDGTVDSSILHLLDRELDTLRSSYPDQWPRMLEYNTLVSKLHMYGLVIVRDDLGNTARDILLKLAFSTCLRIIHLANMRQNGGLPESHGLSASQQRSALPKAYFQGLCFTTIFLIRYFSLNTRASPEEQQLAASNVVISHTIFKSFPSPTDEFVRVARIIEDLCQLGPMTIDSRSVPGDKAGVWILIRALKLASRKRGNNATSNIEPITTASAPSTSLNSCFSAANQALDPWAMDMMLSDQYWSDPNWDPFVEAQFPSGQNG
ncbi:hypothetical protein F5Y09DRAFT_315947 [Xylaria sp. FL1042]|nr:hypothetical protein F5Y09DRAFT_315947 [Xylaria sp. FL1042]